MTSTSHEPPTSRKKYPVSAALHTLEKNVQPLVTFWTKFSNDWSWNNAAGLAYNLILAVFPIVITLLSILDIAELFACCDRIRSLSSVVPDE